MKIFRKFYVRRLYRATHLSEVIAILNPWITEVLQPDNPFLRQVAVYYLRKFGSSYAPRFFKSVISDEILRLNEYDDLKAAMQLAIVEAYRSYNPAKGNISMVSWLSWRIPYELSKLVTWCVTRPITPFEEVFLPVEIANFDRTFEFERQVGIISKDLGLNRQSRRYYLGKVKDNESSSQYGSWSPG